MAEVNWHAFRTKFNNKEQHAFEQLAYQLFCSEYKRSEGIFRFKNQTGIETEPIKVNRTWVGFQAKFFEGSLSTGKNQMISSIRKAKKKNPNLKKILFYVNAEFGESTNRRKKDSAYKTEIEKVAKKLGVTLVWRVPSHIERQLFKPVNQFSGFKIAQCPARVFLLLSSLDSLSL